MPLIDGIRSTPGGLEDVSTFPCLLAELLRRGHSPDDVKRIAGLNVLRVLRDVERIGREMQVMWPAGERLFDAAEDQKTVHAPPDASNPMQESVEVQEVPL